MEDLHWPARSDLFIDAACDHLPVNRRLVIRDSARIQFKQKEKFRNFSHSCEHLLRATMSRWVKVVFQSLHLLIAAVLLSFDKWEVLPLLGLEF